MYSLYLLNAHVSCFVVALFPKFTYIVHSSYLSLHPIK